jgi:hypothetical protein
MATHRSYEDRLDTIVTHAWEQWTNNGHDMDDDARVQTEKSVYDAAANAYVDGIDDCDWLRLTVIRLRGTE